MLLTVAKIKVYFICGYSVQPDFYGNAPVSKPVNMQKRFIEGICCYISSIIKISGTPKDIAENWLIVNTK